MAINSTHMLRLSNNIIKILLYLRLVNKVVFCSRVQEDPCILWAMQGFKGNLKSKSIGAASVNFNTQGNCSTDLDMV